VGIQNCLENLPLRRKYSGLWGKLWGSNNSGIQKLVKILGIPAIRPHKLRRHFIIQIPGFFSTEANPLTTPTRETGDLDTPPVNLG
jgi:hypothetical protein